MRLMNVISRFVLVLMLVFMLGCSGRRITKANVDEVTEGMSKKQVESILGPPTRIETGPEPEPVPVKSVAITRYIYEQDGHSVQLEFVGDHLVPNGIKGSFESKDADSKRTSN